MKQPARGLLIVNTGGGKGKTTAALGMALRARGHGMRVVVLQFIKRAAVSGEQAMAQKVGIELVAGGAGLTHSGEKAEENRRLAVELWGAAREKLSSGRYDLVVLDELSHPLRYGWLDINEVLEVLAQRPSSVHVVVTGREVPAQIIAAADLVTEMKAVKHPLDRGIKAQPGIEF